MTAIDKLLVDYRPWLHRQAWNYTTTEADARDLAQEGAVAMWRASLSWESKRRTHPNLQLRTHCLKMARWRMAEVATKKNFTGRPSRQGVKHVDEDLYDFTYTGDGAVQVAAGDDPSRVEFAYHSAEIREAIRTLTPTQQENIHAHFWRGEHRLTGSAQWWYRKGTGARERLRASLGHLDGLWRE